MTPEVKRLLDAAAEASGRSQSQEAEFRLERSFEREALLEELLIMAYGSKEVAGLVMLVGEAMQSVGFYCRMMGRLREARAESLSAWVSDPFAFHQAFEAVLTVLEAVRPVGEPAGPAGKEGLTPRRSGKEITFEGIGLELAAELISHVRSPQPSTEIARRIHELLGPLTERMEDSPMTDEQVLRRMTILVRTLSRSSPQARARVLEWSREQFRKLNDAEPNPTDEGSQ